MNNDLISRSELKKAFDKWWGCDDIPTNVVEDTIDNAQTVEVETCINYKLCEVRKQCELLKAVEDCED